MKLELFHAIADQGSAKVRKWIGEHELLGIARYRNVAYPEVVADLKAHGGDEAKLPALWDGQTLTVGADAVIAKLEAQRDVGRGEG